MKRVLAQMVLLSAAFLVQSPQEAQCEPAFTGGGAPVAGIAEDDSLGWQLQLVVGRGLTGTKPSIALDPVTRYPHITYYTPGFGLECAWWDGIRWHFETITTEELSAYAPARIIIDSSSRRHVVYAFEAADGMYVGYAYSSINGSWSHEAIGRGTTPAIAVDSNGVPFVIYYQGPEYPSKPRVIKRSGTGVNPWVEVAELGSTFGAYNYAMAFDAGNTLHLIHTVGQAADALSNVQYSRFNGTSWEHETIYSGRRAVAELAVDTSGRPHMVIDEAAGNGLLYGMRDNSGWHISAVEGGCAPSRANFALVLDSSDRPYIGCECAEGGHTVEYKHRASGSGPWTFHSIADADSPALAIWGAGPPQLAYRQYEYKDLGYASYTTNWQKVTVTECVYCDATSLSVDKNGVPSISYDDWYGGGLTVATWSTSGWTRSALPLIGSWWGIRYSSLYTTPAGQSLSFYDPNSVSLKFAHRQNGAAWTVEILDIFGDVGKYSSLRFDAAGRPHIAYFNATEHRIWHASRSAAGGSWELTRDSAGPQLNAASGYTSLALDQQIPPMVYISYYDDVNKDLRLAGLYDGTWSDRLIDSGGDVGKFSSSDSGRNGVRIAYYDATNQAIKLHKGTNPPQTSSIPGTGAVTSLRMKLTAADNPRIAYTSASGAALISPAAAFETYQSEAIDAAARWGISLSVIDRERVSYIDSADDVVYAWRSATLPIPDYNPLQPCPDLQNSAAAHGGARLRTYTPEEVAAMTDLELLSAFKHLLASTAAGQAYVNLYYQHAAETGAIGLADPALLWDSYRTLQNFIPFIAALVSGQQPAAVITQDLVDQLKDLFARLKSAGSAELDAAIDNELSKYNDLQAFVGKTANQALALTESGSAVTSPVYVLWNGFLGMINILELVNKAGSEAAVNVVLYDISGTEVSAVSVPVPAHGQTDLILNELPGFSSNSYGIAKVSFSGNLDGRMSFYRYAADGQSYEFAFAVPFSAPLAGTTAAAFNTFQPSTNPLEHDDLVAQWLSIVNLNANSAKSFTIRRYDESGIELSETRVSVDGMKRIDIEAGHEQPGPWRVGLNVIVPDDPSSPYIAHLVRYGSRRRSGGYAFAFPLLAEIGSGAAQWAPISAGGGGENWMEVVNAGTSTETVNAVLYDNLGNLLHSAELTLPGHSQQHVLASSLLNGGLSGAARLTPASPEARIIANSMFYFREASGSVEAMYGVPSRPAGSGEKAGSYNLFLGMYNWLRVFNTTSAAAEVRISVFAPGGAENERVLTLNPLSGMDFGLHDSAAFGTAPNTYGIVTTGGPLCAELLRLRPGPAGGVDFAVSTAVR